MVHSLADEDSNTKEFVFQNAVPKVIQQETFIADKVDKTTDIENPPIIRKALSVSGLLISDTGGGDSATVKLFSFLDFVIDNINDTMVLTLDLDNGANTKTFNGKLVGEFNGVIGERSPKVVPITFTFVLSDANWGS